VGGLESLPLSLIQDLWKEAERIYSCDRYIKLENGNVCLIGESPVTVDIKKDKITCVCQQFGKLQICCHVLVVADENHCLKEIMARYTYNTSQAVDRNRPTGAGQKRNKKPRKGNQGVKSVPIISMVDNPRIPGEFDHIDLSHARPFQNCEIWHNNQHFTLVLIKSAIRAKRKNIKCQTCTSEFNANPVSPYDIAFEHLERWSYPHQDENGVTVYKNTNKLGSRYYCIRRACILKRHPYFWHGMIDVSKKLRAQ
jgi:hypothetical protein